ncbi:uncharacterized protein Bfra_002787 [Botrytis fragariae]|uniref:Uncharacterized protein n=1 Tax=Botrytis fragariae TaxID=1964551 RepID=A0A8H6AYZ9_9HELO|nr:uncharacterized protein Bfra_002787 [Botrytis fragariae]KAF5876383.1 hypothetical protein Bfra_002787 [Botrytis fragariae]
MRGPNNNGRKTEDIKWELALVSISPFPHPTISSVSARRSIRRRGCMDNLSIKKGPRDGEGKEEEHISSKYGPPPPRRNGTNRPNEVPTIRKGSR